MNGLAHPRRVIGRLASTRASEGSTLRCAGCGRDNRVQWEQLGLVVHCVACRGELPAGGRPIEIDGVGLDELLGAAALPVVVDFWSARYRRGRASPSQLDALAARGAGRYITVELDADLHPQVASRLGIDALPTVAVFADGHELAREANAQSAAAMVEFVDRALASRLPRMSMLRHPAR